MNLIDYIDFIINMCVNLLELVGVCVCGIVKMMLVFVCYFLSCIGMMMSNVVEVGGFIKSDLLFVCFDL